MFPLQTVPTCDGNGDGMLPYGSSQYVGLGFNVFATLVIVELFGSPAMRNISVRARTLAARLVACLRHAP